MKKRYKLVDKDGFIAVAYNPFGDGFREPLFEEERKLLVELIGDKPFTIKHSDKYGEVGLTNKNFVRIGSKFHNATKDFRFYLIMIDELDKFFIEA